MGKLVSAGVFPVHNNEFKIKVKEEKVTIKGLENFSPSFDNTVEEWNAMEDEGWISRLLTGKAWAISFSGKRVIGDTGNDYVSAQLFSIGQDANVEFEWTMPSGTKIEQTMVCSVSNNGGGDTTSVGALEFELQSTGKPTVTPAA